MKKQYLMLSAALLLAGAAHAQGTELFFSEYNEGAHQSGVNYGGTANSTGNERALEIFNPTINTVNLNAYSIRRYSNGAPLGSPLMEEERLVRRVGANTLAPSAAFVVGATEATIPAIVGVANQISAPRQSGTGAANPNVIAVGGTVWFNGDDAMALVRYPSGTAGQGNGVIIDIIGSIGEQPLRSDGTVGGQWSGTNPADGTPAVFVLSANQSIMRRPAVSGGLRTNPPAQNVPGPVGTPPVRAVGGYNIATEWMMYGTAFNGPGGASNPAGQDYSRLGEHNDYTGPNGTYGPLSTLAKFDAGISLYPNPATGTATVELKDVKVGSISVLTGIGQTVTARATDSANRLTLDVSGLKAGLYFVQFVSADGQTTIYKTLQVQ